MTKSALANRLLLLLIFLPTIFIILFGYQQLSPIHVLDIKRVTILTPVSEAGKSITYEFEYCQYRDIRPVVYRQLVPSNPNNIVTFPAVLGVVRSGCHTNSIVLPLPVGIQPGHYHLTGIITYGVTSLRTVEYHYTSENTFEVK
jgi:hypothetical protein